ncbi:Na(+)/H(+) antiporter subunit F1 [Paenibacillus sp. IB182496]|uniref:Na(+)/H(+) antiporter subunit F1 n=1 Tax=Paenibacillus sabuli TaxID=2772509 RepID=A0A927BS82_9BACL|nr:Na(+)/H(+) antiporter subunit F1 [Paenibacillus sabuli]MBD2844579.1 Na(+)/H(+) antiporter subunit F1 [Paenibacillus sabuli]
MLQVVLYTALVLLSLSVVAGLYRIIRGPSMPDRVIALDTIGICLIGLVAVVCMLQDTTAYLDIILLMGILAFLGTVAFSKFIEKGVVMEHARNRDDHR